MLTRSKNRKLVRSREVEASQKVFDLEPKNDTQRAYLEALEASSQVIVLGPSGCKSGDTIIHYNRGNRTGFRKITLEDFVARFNKEAGNGRGKSWRGVHKTFVRSYNEENHTLVRNEVEGAWRTGVKESVLIQTDISGHVKITLDDKVLLHDGVFKTVKDVVIGDRLLCKGKKKVGKGGGAKQRETKRKRVVVESLKYYKGGWNKYVKDRLTGKLYSYKRTHKARLVLEADLNNTTYEDYVHALRHEPYHRFTKLLSKDMEVHHIDEDVTNDELSNLELLTKEAHAALHFRSKGPSQFGYEELVVATVISVENLGPIEVFDLTMKAPHHNFMVNDGIITHNTGKSYVAASYAASLYACRDIRKIVITRPAVSVGRSLGALPGTLDEKFSPWMSPILEIFSERLGKTGLEAAVRSGGIIMAPLEYMRGSTFKDAYVICEEGQNLTIPEFKMLVTRIGENCNLVINGDIKQSDLREQSGLSKAIELARKYNMDVPVIEFGLEDIIRSDICKAWVTSFYKECL